MVQKKSSSVLNIPCGKRRRPAILLGLSTCQFQAGSPQFYNKRLSGHSNHQAKKLVGDSRVLLALTFGFWDLVSRIINSNCNRNRKQQIRQLTSFTSSDKTGTSLRGLPLDAWLAACPRACRLRLVL